MRSKLYSLKRGISIYLKFAQNSLQSYMEYKANFYASLTMEIVFLFSKLIYVIFAYSIGTDIGGITPDQLLLFTGTYTIMIAIYTGVFMDNFYGLQGLIGNGMLDMYITKPISLLFMVSLRHVNYALPIPNLIAGITMVVIGWRRNGIPVDLIHISGYLLLIASSTVVMYAVLLLPQILCFWTIRTGAVTELLDKSWDLNNMPMYIYKKWFQRLGIYFIPILFITNMPAGFLVGKMTCIYWIWVIVAPVLFFSLLKMFWNYAIRSYSSASS